jgi:hypothetical protein
VSIASLIRSLSFLVSIAATLPASAQQTFVELTTLQGCKFYTHTGAITREAFLRNTKAYTYDWTGSCTKGRPIEGDGTLITKVVDNQGAYATRLTGTFVDGVPNGKITFVSEIGDTNPRTSDWVYGCQPLPEFLKAVIRCTPKLAKGTSEQIAGGASNSSSGAGTEIVASKGAAKLSSGGGSAQPDYSDRQEVIAASGQPAHECLSLIPEGYGGFKNSCDFSVNYTYCAYHPKKGSWVDSASFNCESSQNTKSQSGYQTVRANGADGNHTHGAEKIFWFGCKEPAHPYQVKFDGRQLFGMCKER